MHRKKTEDLIDLEHVRFLQLNGYYGIMVLSVVYMYRCSDRSYAVV